MMYFPEPNACNSAYYVVQRIVRDNINVVLPGNILKFFYLANASTTASAR